jgi:hypothetical protein
MGAMEILMTWAYAVSGVVGGMESFVRLSVITRLLAMTVLFVGWTVDHCILEQVQGVMGDAALAVVTVIALRVAGVREHD